MWLWLVCIFQLAFADETLRIAVLEFQTVQTMDPNFMLQLSDETRGGALDVFPPSTSKVSVLTRENLMDVITQQGKDASCLEGNCAVGIGRNIGARFVVVGSVAQVEGVYRLTLGVYDSNSNDLLGQKSIQEMSQVTLLGEVRPFAEGLIEQTLGAFDEGRLGVRQIGGELDTWKVSGSTQGILGISEPRLKGAKISVNGREVCDVEDKSTCRVLVEQGDVTVSIERQYCDVFTEKVSVGRMSRLEPPMDCRFAVLEPKSEWTSTKLDGNSVTSSIEIAFGTHILEVERPCQRSKASIVVNEGGIQHVPAWEEKTRTLKVTYVDEEKSSVSVPVILDGVQVGETPFEQGVSVCSRLVEVRGERVQKITLSEIEDWNVQVSDSFLKQQDYTGRIIPAGTVTMGCTSTQSADCTKWSSNILTNTNDLFMMESEIVQELYLQVMHSNPSHFSGNNLPVENVNWYNAVNFANTLSAMEGLKQCYTINGNTVEWSAPNCTGWRLPTEEEWEYALAISNDEKGVDVLNGKRTQALTVTAVNAVELNNMSESYRQAAHEKRLESIERARDMLSAGALGGDAKAKVQFRMAEMYFEEGRFYYFHEMQDYQTKYNDCVNATPQRCDVNKMSPDNTESLKWHRSAIRLYDAILRNHSQYQRADEVLFYLGSAYQEIGESDKAKAQFVRLTKEYSRSKYVARAYVQIGEYFFDRDKTYEALQAYAQAVKFKNDNSYGFAVYKLSWCYYNLGEYEQAIQGMKTVVRKDGDAGNDSSAMLLDRALRDIIGFFHAAGYSHDKISEYLSTKGYNSNGQTHTVCDERISSTSICDMTGNVWEWVWDIPSVDDTMHKASSTQRIIRGGGWNTYGLNNQNFSYSTVNMMYTSNDLGFRLVRKP